MDNPFLSMGEQISYSYSRLGSYATCPAKLYFRRLEKEGKFQSLPKIAATFGSAGHIHCEKRLKSEDGAPEAIKDFLNKDLFDKYDGKVIDANRFAIAEAKKNMERGIDSFENHVYPNLIGEIKDPKSQVEVSLEMPWRKGKLVGKLDVLTGKGIDFKFGKISTPEESQRTPQGGIYRLLTRALDIPMSQFMYVFLKGINTATKVAKTGKNKGEQILDKDNPTYAPVLTYADWPDEKVDALEREVLAPVAKDYEEGKLSKRGKQIMNACGMCEYRKVCDDYDLPVVLE